MTRPLLLLLAALYLGRAGVADAATSPQPPVFRLGDAVRPVFYDAELTVIPNQDRFFGRIALTLDLAEPTNLIWIHASHLDFRKVTLSTGQKAYPARAVPTGRDVIGIRLPQTIAMGRVVLAVEYEGSLDRINSSGAFRAHEGDDWYAFGMFEPTFARRVFPCLDEPGWKVPWRLTLDVPASDLATSNTPVLAEESMPGNMKRVHFALTAPLASYQIAFAVGPFDAIDAGKIGRRAVPLRYLVPRGRAAEMRFAQRVTPRLLENIEDYLSVPYPFEKLDEVALPITSGLSASASPGLVSFRGDFVLAKSDQEGSEFQKTYVAMAARQMARQWFGGVVALSWWDDLWVNEGLAGWMSDKITQRFNPEWLTRLALDRERQDAISLDQLDLSRALHASVNSPEDLGAAFELTTSAKSAAVMRMLESWIGEDRFRAAVKRYLAGPTTPAGLTDDFSNALNAEAGGEQTSLGAAFHSMAERAGVAELDVSLSCPAAGKGSPRLELAQQRFAPASRLLSNTSPAKDAGAWAFPACFQYGEGGDFGEECIVVHDTRQVMQLPDGESCPDWVVANRDGTSYIVPVLKDPLPGRLEHAPLLPDEAVAVIGDTRILAASHDVPLDRALAMAARFATTRQPPVAQAALALVDSVPAALLSSSDDREGYARFIRVEFGPRAQALGWLAKPGEREVDGLLRADLLPLVADRGADLALRAQADKLARDWLAGRSNLGVMLRPILLSAAHFGASDLFEGYVAAAERSSGRERRDLYSALGAFRDPLLLAAALNLVLSDRLDPRDAWAILTQAGADPASVPQVLHFAADHYDALLKRLPENAPSWIAGLGRHLCDASSRHDFDDFFGDPARRTLEGSRSFELALQAADLCIANREFEAPLLRAFLAAPIYRN
jgi:alanyl aminopeptidase